MEKRWLFAASFLLLLAALAWWSLGAERTPAAPPDVVPSPTEPARAPALAEAPGGAGEERAAAVEADQGRASAVAPSEEGSATLVVRVVRSDTGEALPLERVTLVRDDGVQLFRSGGTRSAGMLGDLLATDELGRCTFQVPPAMAVRALHFGGEGRDGELPVPPLVPGESREVVLAVAPPAARAVVVVKVVRGDTGEALAGERVVLLRAGDTRSANRDGSTGEVGDVVQTDEQGTCRFLVPPDTPTRAVSLLALFGGRDDEEVRVPALAADETREIVLAIPVFEHWVRVVDARDGGAIANARVGTQDGRRAVTTDTGGFARTWCSEWSDENASVEAAGYGPALFTLRRGHGAPEEALVLRLSAGACLAGSVVDAAGSPVSGALVRVVAGGGALSRTPELSVREDGSMVLFSHKDKVWRAVTDPSGAFELCDLPAGVSLPVRVAESVGAQGTPAETLHLQPGETRRVTLRLDGGSTLAGRVVDAGGRPIAGCEVWLVPGERGAALTNADRPTKRVQSGADGRFVFDEVASGEWSLCPGPRTGFLASPVHVRVSGNSAPPDVRIEAREGAFVRGVVVDPRGEPLSGVLVMSDHGLSEQSASNGAFELGPFVPGEVVVLGAFGLGPYKAPRDFRVQAGDRGVVLRLEEGGTLSGRVVDRAGGGPAGGMLTVMGSDGVNRYTTLDPAGEFSFRGLAVGTYTLVAHTADGRAGLLDGVELREEGARVDGLTIEVARGGRLSVRFPASEERRSYRVRSGATVLLRDGVLSEETSTPPLAPGAVVVELLAAGGIVLESRDAEVVAGETRLVDFQ